MTPDRQQARAGYPRLAPPSKFTPFPGLAPAIRRERLLARLRDLSSHRLVIVQAPAGSGKTVLLAQYREQLLGEDRSCSWLSGDETDSTPSLVMSALVEALTRAGLDVSEELVSEAFAVLGQSEDQAVRLLVLAITPPSRQTTLIIDGFDSIRVPLAGRIVEALIRHVEHLHLVLATRARAAISQGWLVAAGEVQFVHSGELNFDLEEVRRLLDGTVPEDYAGLFHAKTDGMPIAIQLAHRAARQGQSGRRPPASTPSWRDALHDYYREQILEELPPELQSFVRKLAILETFDTLLAKAVSGDRAASLIERLYRVHGLLLRDSHTGLFHFPETLREFLLDDLQWLDDDERRQMHLRAAEWFMARNNHLEALLHALSAGDGTLALSLFDQIGGSGVTLRYGLPVLKSVLAHASTEGQQQPLLKLSQALLLVQEGNAVEAGAILQEIKQSEGERPDHTKRHTRDIVDNERVIVDTLISGYMGSAPDDEDVAALNTMATTLQKDDRAFRGLASNLLCWIRYQNADLKGAEAAAQHAVSAFVDSNSPYGGLFMHFHRIAVQYWQNDLSGALTEAVASESLVELFYPADARLSALSRLFRDFVLLEVGRLGDPSEFLSTTLEDISEHEGWIEAHAIAHHTAARALYASYGALEALLVVGQGITIAERLELPRLECQMHCLEVEMLTRSGQLGQARAAARRYQLACILQESPAKLSWKERYWIALALGRLELTAKRFDCAERWLRLLERDAELATVPRVRAKLAIMLALLRQAQGRKADACRHLAGALSLVTSPPPVALFREEGPAFLNLLRAFAGDGHDRGLKPVMDQILAGNGRPSSGHGDEGKTAMHGRLTPREQEIMSLIEEGSPNKIAAYRLGLSEATIKFHLRKIYRKLNARNRTQALARYRAMNS